MRQEETGTELTVQVDYVRALGETLSAEAWADSKLRWAYGASSSGRTSTSSLPPSPTITDTPVSSRAFASPTPRTTNTPSAPATVRACGGPIPEWGVVRRALTRNTGSYNPGGTL